MKTQITNHNNESISLRCGINPNRWNSLALAVLVLLMTVSYASAQEFASSAPGCQYKPNVCSNYVGQLCGINLCPSNQYRSGSTGAVYPALYNADLTGSPFAGGATGVLNSTSVNPKNLSLKFPPIPAPGRKGCGSAFGGALNPTASPAIRDFIVFPANDGHGHCTLYNYSLEGVLGSLTKVIGPDTIPVTSSPWRHPQGASGPNIIASEDGNLYGLPPGGGWTFNPGTGNPIDSSPVLAFDSSGNPDGIYVVDILGTIYKVDPYTGKYYSTWPAGGIHAPLYPGGVLPDNAGTYAPSASSVAVSTCGSSGLYSPCTMLFVAGYAMNVPTGDEVCAYDSGNAYNYWCKTFGPPNNAITSSPVVSDSLGLVYVMDYGSYGGKYSTSENLYALDQNPIGTGIVLWSVSLAPPPSGWDYYVPLPYGGSPAYDDSANNGASKYVITAGSFQCWNGYGGKTEGCGPNGTNSPPFSVLNVFDATAAGNGKLVCGNQINHTISQSSPEVVNGVIYVGTDDGYVLAFDETKCQAGSLPLIWTSDTADNCTNGPPCPMDSPMAGPPVVSFNRIHAVSQSGTLYSWGLPGY